MRRCALILNINLKTVARKLIYLSKKSQLEHQVFLNSLKHRQILHLQFDDLITIEHTKLKPYRSLLQSMLRLARF